MHHSNSIFETEIAPDDENTKKIQITVYARHRKRPMFIIILTAVSIEAVGYYLA
jgi:hypothetical protein